MNIKPILTFFAGLVVGGAAGVLGTKKHFEEKYQKRYEEDHDALEEYYHRVDEYARQEKEPEEEDDPNDQNEVETDSRPGGRMSPEERKAIKEKLHKNWEGTTNYAAMYKGPRVDLAEKEHPLDQGEEGETGPEDLEICANCKFYDNDMNLCLLHEDGTDAASICNNFENMHDTSPEEEAFDEHRKNMNKPPKIISAEAYSNLPAYIEQEVLYFYAYDEVLCDENEEEIDEPAILIGDALTKYDFVDSDERILFVMNYATDTCYEIQKVDASWTDSH